MTTSRPPSPRMMVVAGTGTEIGKSVVTAALAALARSEGLRVGIAKPIQTGKGPGAEGDCEFAARLSGAEAALESIRMVEALAPETAARRSGLAQPTTGQLTGAVREWAAAQDPPLDLVFVEGNGGILVRFGTDVTILDLAADLDASVLLVTRAGLGTLSDTELAARAVADAGLECAGVVIGSWPHHPDLACRTNLEDLPRLTGQPLLGSVPENAGVWAPADFRDRAPGWFEPGMVDRFPTASGISG